LLQRFIGRGKGVVAKTFPNVDISLYRRARELNSDYIFILDKPNVSQEFFEEAKNNNIPIVWIDHHETNTKIPPEIFYYNSFDPKKGTGEPVTYISYKVTNKKEDLWIETIGCISDSFMSENYKEFLKEYPGLGIETKEPFEVLYKSEIGKISRMLNSGLMDTTTNIVKMLKYLFKVTHPTQILEENEKTYEMREKFKFIERKRKKFVEKAVKNAKENENYLVFEYSGDTSMSAEIANELHFLFPKKYIIVIYKKENRANISTRGENVKEKVIKSIKNFKAAVGGGHKNAAGAQIQTDEIDAFIKEFLKLI
jgi:single-stranded DNA-specific DHH superfamily exonuclease